MFNFYKKKVVVVHSGNFHADDAFAVAVFGLFLGAKQKIKVLRTRDKKIIESADYVADVGGIYDPSKNRFDHHQIGGAGKRANGIPYASFGLVWKEYGEKICGSREVAERIDKNLVSPIDASDNGVSVFELKIDGVSPYTIQSIIALFRPNWKNKDPNNNTQAFFKFALFAKEILEKEILLNSVVVLGNKKVLEAYNNSEDKRIIVLDKHYSWQEVLCGKVEPLFVVYESGEDKTWHTDAVPVSPYSFELRKQFPISWAGKRDEELAEITGIKDAVFCHNARFLTVTKTKESAIVLARKACL